MNLTNVISLPVKSATALSAYQRVKTVTEDGQLKLDVAGAADQAIGVTLSDWTADQVGAADVALFNAGGVHYAVASAAIALGATVQGAASGKIANLAGGKPLGIAMKAASGNGSIIRIVTFAAAAIPASDLATPGNTNGEFSGLNSTAVNPTKADFDALLAKCEELGDDFRALVAALVARGVFTLV